MYFAPTYGATKHAIVAYTLNWAVSCSHCLLVQVTFRTSQAVSCMSLWTSGCQYCSVCARVRACVHACVYVCVCVHVRAFTM